jgi:hypothetical protein
LDCHWWPDSSKNLVFNQGSVSYGATPDSANELDGVYEISIAPDFPKKISSFHRYIGGRSYGGGNNNMVIFYDISPDGRQILTYIRNENNQYGFGKTLSLLNLGYHGP